MCISLKGWENVLCKLGSERVTNLRLMCNSLQIMIAFPGGYEVASQDENYDYHINVCRGITPETGGHTQSCPDGSSSCRVEPKLSKSIGMGEIASNTSLQAGASNEIILKYEVKDPVLCRMNLKIKPVTTITFMCPKELHQSVSISDGEL